MERERLPAQGSLPSYPVLIPWRYSSLWSELKSSARTGSCQEERLSMWQPSWLGACCAAAQPELLRRGDMGDTHSVFMQRSQSPTQGSQSRARGQGCHSSKGSLLSVPQHLQARLGSFMVAKQDSWLPVHLQHPTLHTITESLG